MPWEGGCIYVAGHGLASSWLPRGWEGYLLMMEGVRYRLEGQGYHGRRGVPRRSEGFLMRAIDGGRWHG